MDIIKWIKKKIASLGKKQSKSLIVTIDSSKVAKSVRKATHDTTQEDEYS